MFIDQRDTCLWGASGHQRDIITPHCYSNIARLVDVWFDVQSQLLAATARVSKLCW